MTDPVDSRAVTGHGTPILDNAPGPGEERVVPRAHFRHHELLRPRVMAVMATTSAIFVVFAVAVAPSGTQTLTWLQRILYFGSIAAFGFPSCYSMVTLALYFTRTESSLLSTVAALAVTVLGCVPVTAMVCVYPLMFYPGRAVPHFGMAFVTVVAPATSACLLLLYVIHQRIRDYREAGWRPVFPRFRGKSVGGTDAGSLGAAPAGGRRVSRPPEPAPNRAAPVAAPAATPVRDFLSRLPADLGDELIFIKTEGHYLRVYTDTGSTRLLMRFADAVAALAGLGMQVHRSYWVAHDHVVGLVTRDGRPALLLTGDHLVPVSRTYVRAVRAATS